jgi:predicted small secreted protein
MKLTPWIIASLLFAAFLCAGANKLFIPQEKH